jgi:hypothetical protein
MNICEARDAEGCLTQPKPNCKHELPLEGGEKGIENEKDDEEIILLIQVAIPVHDHKISGMQIDWVSDLAAMKRKGLRTRRRG